MKRFLAISAFIIAAFMDTIACTSEAPTYNYYMFSVFNRDKVEPQFLTDIADYWRRYTGKEANTDGTHYYEWNAEEIRKTAKQKGDTQMTAYLKQLDAYREVANDVSQDSWDYPTKKQIAQRRQTLLNVLTAAKAYRGTKLKSMYALLVMRANMMLGYDNANLTYWETTANRLPQSAWREAMRNIYARALYKKGEWRKASDIYAEQGDMTSIMWMTRKYRNLAGIKSFYDSDPNSPTLNYLVQDFVNNAQETLDMKATDQFSEDWIKVIGAQAIFEQDMNNFIAFADGVVNDGKTNSPSLWRTATGMLHYLLGQQREATADMDEAINMNGTQRMKDNARAIRLLVATKNAPKADYLIKELNWLDTKISEEGNGFFASHYADVKKRVVFKGLIPMYNRAGNHNMAIALCGMITADNNAFLSTNHDWNIAYNGDYFMGLDSLSADSLAAYTAYLFADKADAFERYVSERAYRNASYYNDLIGTKLIAEGRFADAIPYLQKVSLDFMDKQAICFYMARRDFTVERWFKRQLIKDDDFILDEEIVAATPKLTTNQKLDFCRTMVDMQARHNVMREGTDRQQLAYDMAVRYCQASYYGDCWYLSHYGKSVNDTVRDDEQDFLAKTIDMLTESAASTDTALRYHSLYALALLPNDPWYTENIDSEYNMVLVPLPQSRQYKALASLSRFATENPQAIDHYTSKCDVLKQFSKYAATK